MKENKNIEDLFKDKFENFEVEPKSDSWKKVAAVIGVGASAAAGGASSYLSLGKIIAAASIVGSASIGGYFLLKDNSDKIIAENTKPVVKETPVIPQTKETTITIPENAIAYNAQPKKSTEVASIKKETPVVVAEQPKVEAPIVIVPELKKEPVLVKETPAEKKEQPSSEKKEIPAIKTELSPEKISEELTNSNYKLASIIASAVNGYTPLSISFTNAGGATNNKWNFGDGTEVSKDISPNHTFNKVGNFKVTLASNENGRTEFDTITIHVLGSSFIAEVPNAFTPNGDGDNDFFEIKSFDLTSLKVTIVNPSGKEVSTWNTPEGKWDGRMPNGEMAIDGPYSITYSGEGIDGKVFPPTVKTIYIKKR